MVRADATKRNALHAPMHIILERALGETAIIRVVYFYFDVAGPSNVLEIMLCAKSCLSRLVIHKTNIDISGDDANIHGCCPNTSTSEGLFLLWYQSRLRRNQLINSNNFTRLGNILSSKCL